MSTPSSRHPSVKHTPYGDPSLNAIYHLLFCDDIDAFVPRADADADAVSPSTIGWQRLLADADSAVPALEALANDASTEARVRALAFARLRQRGQVVRKGELLGVIFEVPMEGGLDTLAAYVDGSVRFLHHAAAPAFIETPLPSLQASLTRTFDAAAKIVSRIGPTDDTRRAPPVRDVRLSFLVSDGLYFGEGSMETLSHDPMAGPLLEAGGALLARVVDLVQGRSTV